MEDILFSDIKSIGKKDVPYSADDFAVGGAVRNSPMVSANSFFPDLNLLWIGSDGIIYKNGKDKNKTGRWVKTKIKAEAIKVNYQGVDYNTFVNSFNSLSTSGTDIIPLVTNDGVVNYTQANNLVYIGVSSQLSITAVETAIEIGFIKKGWLKMSKSAKKTATKTPKPTTKSTTDTFLETIDPNIQDIFILKQQGEDEKLVVPFGTNIKIGSDGKKKILMQSGDNSTWFATGKELYPTGFKIGDNVVTKLGNDPTTIDGLSSSLTRVDVMTSSGNTSPVALKDLVLNLAPINPHKVWIEGTPLLTQQAIVIELEKRGFTLSKNKYLQPKEGRTGLGVTEERNIVFTSLEKKEFNSGRSLYGTELKLQELLDLFPILTPTSTSTSPKQKRVEGEFIYLGGDTAKYPIDSPTTLTTIDDSDNFKSSVRSSKPTPIKGMANDGAWGKQTIKVTNDLYLDRTYWARLGTEILVYNNIYSLIYNLRYINGEIFATLGDKRILLPPVKRLSITGFSWGDKVDYKGEQWEMLEPTPDAFVLYNKSSTVTVILDDINEITSSRRKASPTKKDVTIPNSDLKIGDVVEITEKSSVDFGTVTNVKGFEETYGVLLFHLSGIEDEDGESIGFTRDMLKLRDKLRELTIEETNASKLVNNSQNRFILSDDNDKELQDISDLLEYFDGTTNVSARKKLYEEADKIIKKRYGNEQMDNAEFGVNNRKNLITPINLLDYYFTQTTQSPVASVKEPCGLPTPNGKKSKLPLQTYLAVRTPYFKRWFGDWIKAYDTGEYADCSLVIDKDTKEPRIMYHGVRKFIKGYGSFANMGQGVTRPYGSFEPPKFPASYFGDNLNYIEFYGGNATNMRKPSPEYKGFYYNVFLNMRNPIRLDLLGFEASYTDFIDFMFVKYGIEVTPDPQLVPKVGMTKKNKIWVYVRNGAGMIKLLKDNGYDGIVQLGDVPKFDKSGNIISEPLIDREYLTFYANQVKSANVRNSFYLGFFNDIRFKDGGNVSI